MYDLVVEHQDVLWWMVAGSVAMALAGVVIIPWIIIRLPASYFAHRRRDERILVRRHPVTGAAILVLKNVAGAILVVAGILMLVLPGQGVLSILVGLTLLNFPGKYRVERWIVTRPAVRELLNWLRRRAGKPPLEL